MRMTEKQIKILGCLLTGNKDGSELDLDQLLDKLAENYNWTTSKASMHFSLRPMIGAGVIEKSGYEIRRGRQRTVLGVTDLGKRIMGADPGS